MKENSLAGKLTVKETIDELIILMETAGVNCEKQLTSYLLYAKALEKHNPYSEPHHLYNELHVYGWFNRPPSKKYIEISRCCLYDTK